MLPVGNKKVELVFRISRLQCKKCGAIKQPRLSFADPKSEYINPSSLFSAIRGMKAIVENSFLKDHMKGLGGMPEGVKKLINLLEP
jgi:hypothetical protein